MRKILVISFVSIITMSFAQTEGFENGFPPSWATINSMGFPSNGNPSPDSLLWSVNTDDACGSSNMMWCRRYNIGMGNASYDWLIMPLAEIPLNGVLNFKAKTAFSLDQNTKLLIYASPNGEQANLSDYQVIAEFNEPELNPTAGSCDSHTLPLPAYLYGESVYIGFVREHIQVTPATSGDVFYIDDVSITENLSVDDFSMGLKWYPNPVHTNINLESNVDVDTVKIFNVLGAEVAALSVTGQSIQVPVNNLPNGVYFFKVYSNEKSKTFKIIKN